MILQTCPEDQQHEVAECHGKVLLQICATNADDLPFFQQRLLAQMKFIC